MRKQVQLLIIHCTATPEGRTVTPGQIDQWHLGPHDLTQKEIDDELKKEGSNKEILKPGVVKYLGALYPNRNNLPDDEIEGIKIKFLHGHGWKSRGYTDELMLDANWIRVTRNNDDDYVDPFEVTNGVLGYQRNSVARNIVYVGGCANDGKLTPKDTRTPEQKRKMAEYVIAFVNQHPQVQVGGHNQFDHKACPCFDVPEWCRHIGIPEENIYTAPLLVKLNP